MQVSDGTGFSMKEMRALLEQEGYDIALVHDVAQARAIGSLWRK